MAQDGTEIATYRTLAQAEQAASEAQAHSEGAPSAKRRPEGLTFTYTARVYSAGAGSSTARVASFDCDHSGALASEYCCDFPYKQEKSS
jgi:hypothetical protein